MDKNDLSGIRVLLVGMRGHGAQILRTVMTAAGISRIVSVEETLPALEMLCGESFDAVLVEGLLQHDGVPFAIAARRTEALLNPMIPIFVVYANARRRDVEKARDLGTTDILCRPISPKTLTDKLRAALLKPRPFIVAPDFFGPERRARTKAGFFGKDRRTRSARKAKVHFAENPLERQ